MLSNPCARRTQADGDALQELLTTGSLPMTVFRTDGIDAAFEKVQAFGTEVLQVPIDQPWGSARLCVPGPLGQYGAHLAGAESVTIAIILERRLGLGLPAEDGVLERRWRGRRQAWAPCSWSA